MGAQTTHIYKLADPRKPEEVRYVGKANDIHERLKGHIDCANLPGAKITKCVSWLKSLRAAGIRPTVELIEVVNFTEPSEWGMREQYWIDFYRAEGHPITNLARGGSGGYTGPASEETRRKISEGGRGKKRSDITKRRMSVARKGIFKQTDEAKAKLSLAHSGKTLSASHKQAIASANTGHITSDETRIKIGNAHRGKFVSAESRAKMSAAKTGTIPTEEARKNMSLAALGKPKNPEAVRKSAESRKGMKKKPATDEYRERQSIRMKESWAERKAAKTTKEFNINT